MDRKERRQKVYNELIKAGYTAKEARKLRDVSFQKLAEYTRQNKKSTKAIEKVGKVYGASQEKIQALKEYSNFRNLIYEKAEKNYLQKYNYIIRYEKGKKVVGKWTDRTEHYLTVTSNRVLSKKEILQDFWEWYDGSMDANAYNSSEVIRGSVTIERAYISGR